MTVAVTDEGFAARIRQLAGQETQKQESTNQDTKTTIGGAFRE